MRFRSVFSVFHRFQTIHAASGPVGYFDGMTTYSILFPANAEFLESKGADFGAVTPDSILYNGCYILSSLVPSQEVRFDANPNYYDADNVKVQHVVVTYTNAEDPAQGFNMFVNGEVSSARINASLPDVVAKANELYPDNQFKSLTTATSYWGAFNWDRRLYALYNDPSVSTTSKTTEEQKNDTRTAILNANFRRAVYAAYSAHAVQAITNGEENADDTLRNTLVPYTFATTSDGRSDGAIVTKYVEELVPEYGDPLTYIHCFDIHDGDMLNYSGINYESQGQDDEQKAILKTLGLEDIQAVVDEAVLATGDERIELFAKAEAMLLTGGILRPYATSGATLQVSKVKPFTAAYGLYGQASYNRVPYFKFMQLLDEPVLAADYYAAKEAWLAGE